MIQITDRGACRAIARSIRALRHGNRLMVNQDLNLTLTLHRREEPQKTCGVAKINGSVDYSLLDAALFGLLGTLALSILGAIRSILRHI